MIRPTPCNGDFMCRDSELGWVRWEGEATDSRDYVDRSKHTLLPVALPR